MLKELYLKKSQQTTTKSWKFYPSCKEYSITHVRSSIYFLQLESFKNFDFELWKSRYLKWMQTKKMRITDFFRRQDKDGDGFLSRDEFVSGMLQSGKIITF